MLLLRSGWRGPQKCGGEKGPVSQSPSSKQCLDVGTGGTINYLDAVALYLAPF